MKVDFLATWDAFLEASRHCRYIKYQDKDGEIIIRAGGNGFRYPVKGDDFNTIRAWCETHAYRIVESLPEELVFA